LPAILSLAVPGAAHALSPGSLLGTIPSGYLDQGNPANCVSGQSGNYCALYAITQCANLGPFVGTTCRTVAQNTCTDDDLQICA
jgi:hypothetical protein